MNKIFRNLDKYELLFSEIEGADVSEDIVITTKAMNEMLRSLVNNFGEDSDYFIRLSLKTTDSCSKRFAIIFDKNTNNNDKIFELRKIKVVVDRKSIFYFLGIIVDYINNEKGKGYLFINNLSENTIIPSEEEIEDRAIKSNLFC